MNRRKLDLSAANDVQKRRALGFVLDFRQKEIDRFWSRTSIFWGFVVATFVAFGVLYDKVHDDKMPLLIVACFGFISSFSWAIQSRGSKYWLEQMETKVKILERDVLKIALVANKEPLEEWKWWGASPVSVTRPLIAVSDFAVIVWGIILYQTYNEVEHCIAKTLSLDGIINAPTFVVVLTLGYAALIYTKRGADARVEKEHEIQDGSSPPSG